MKITSESNAFLFDVYANDFDDNYHRLETEPSTELEKEARRIRRRYKNLTDYMKALTVYNEYMALLAQKHGGNRLFSIKLKNELIEDFIPPNPRMKNTIMNKFLLKNHIVLSSGKSGQINEDGIEEIIEETDADAPVPEFDPIKFDPAAKQLAKEAHSTISTKKIKAITSVDYLEEYFQTKNVVVEEKKFKKLPSLKQVMSGKYEGMPTDTEDEDDVIFYKGNYMHRSTVEELQVYQNLGDLGWNSVKVMKNKGASKNVTKFMKEKNKKDQKKDKKNKKNDDFLIKVMGDSSYDSFSDFEEEMLDFTSKNIFK